MSDPFRDFGVAVHVLGSLTAKGVLDARAYRRMLPLTHALEDAERTQGSSEQPADQQPYGILMMRFLLALSDAATDNGPEQALGFSRAAVARYDADQLTAWQRELQVLEYISLL